MNKRPTALNQGWNEYLLLSSRKPCDQVGTTSPASFYQFHFSINGLPTRQPGRGGLKWFFFKTRKMSIKKWSWNQIRRQTRFDPADRSYRNGKTHLFWDSNPIFPPVLQT
ncbi:hypothetical protein [Rhizobium ruizarguesonis]|uniref:hypothetical protein n=1 Tax=Rhizobium ruizarguesonis TaxID=2081791 RepID=UPI001030F1F4|nr:hypothetical protein [Rhizobium ruizarguesonis]TBD09922.1 hypothetical protein ELH23_33530 [Rhizobium ruizarguesonis]